MTLLVLALDPDQGGRLGHEGHAIDLAERCLNVALSRRMGLDDDWDGLSGASPFAAWTKY
jgi:hypothetical protein